jgi:copper transport protein
VLGVAWYSRRLVRAKTAETQPRGLRRAVFAELGITAVVLGVTAALVQIAPPRTAEAAETATTASKTITRTLRNSTMALQIDIFPGTVGNNSIHLYAYTLDNKPLPVVEWTGTASLPAKNIEPIQIPLLRITDFHAVGDIALPTNGIWTFKFTMRTSDIDETSLALMTGIS